jgi:hypothetical protein
MPGKSCAVGPSRPHVVQKNFLANHQLDIHWCTEFPYSYAGRIAPRVSCAENGGFLGHNACQGRMSGAEARRP